jgi:hypothetical protein
LRQVHLNDAFAFGLLHEPPLLATATPRPARVIRPAVGGALRAPRWTRAALLRRAFARTPPGPASRVACSRTVPSRRRRQCNEVRRPPRDLEPEPHALVVGATGTRRCGGRSCAHHVVSLMMRVIDDVRDARRGARSNVLRPVRGR